MKDSSSKSIPLDELDKKMNQDVLKQAIENSKTLKAKGRAEELIRQARESHAKSVS